MYNKLIKKIHSNLTKDQNLSESSLENIQYSLEILINTVLKLVIPFILFLIMGEMKAYFQILLFIISTRTFIGGLHFESFIGCSLFTSFFFLALYIPSNLFIISKPIGLLIFSFTLLILILYAPVISRNRPTYDSKQKKNFKMISIIITTIYFSLFIIFNNWDFSQIVMWGILLNSIQLLLGKEVNYYYEKQII